MFTQAGGDMLADLAGYFIGAAAPAPFGGPVNAPPPGCSTPRVGYAGAPVGPIIWGSSRAAVATLQGRLAQLGFWNAGAEVTDYNVRFFHQTIKLIAALLAFQVDSDTLLVAIEG